MKVYIGKYKNYWNIFSITHLCSKLGVSESTCDKIEDFLSNTKLVSFLGWLNSKRNRSVYVKIDDYDIWSLDHTLAYIILPCLKHSSHSGFNLSL